MRRGAHVFAVSGWAAVLALAACTRPCLPLLSDDVLGDDDTARYAAASRALHEGQHEEARVALESLVHDHPDYFPALRDLMDVQLALSLAADVEHDLAERLTRRGDALAHLLAARLADQRGDTVTAASELARATELDPENPHVRYAHAVAAARDSKFDVALDELDAVLDSCSPQPEAFLARARVRTVFGRFEEAFADYTAYFAHRDGDNVALHEAASLLHRELSRPSEASELYQRMLKNDPEDAAAAIGLAVVATERGEFATAEALYRGVTDREPIAWFNLGLLYRDRLDRKRDALTCFEHFVQYDGANADHRSTTDVIFVAPNYIAELRQQLGEGSR